MIIWLYDYMTIWLYYDYMIIWLYDSYGGGVYQAAAPTDPDPAGGQRSSKKIFTWGAAGIPDVLWFKFTLTPIGWNPW